MEADIHFKLFKLLLVVVVKVHAEMEKSGSLCDKKALRICSSLNWSRAENASLCGRFMVASFLFQYTPTSRSCGAVNCSCFLLLEIMQRASRLKKELHMLAVDPPPGITCWQEKDGVDDLRARRYPIRPVMVAVALLEIVLRCTRWYSWT